MTRQSSSGSPRTSSPTASPSTRTSCTWDKPWDTVLDTSDAPFWKWFVGGRLNACYNCVDRHAASDPDKTAIIWVPELEEDETVHISYGELLRRVNEFAALLGDFAELKTGDRVTLHMPMVPEAIVTMLACARLGVIHSQVFGGFSGNACGTRIADSGSRVLITMDGYYRAGLARRSQGQGRRGSRRGSAAGSGSGQGPCLAPEAGRVGVADADGRRPRLLRRRGHREIRGAGRRAGFPARRCAAVPDVHQRHDRPARRARSTAPAATCRT